jgi:transposase
MILNRNQKKELVIKLYEEGKTTREIAKEVRISLRDIGIILKEYNKEPEPEKPKSNRARAIQMFLEGKQPV